MKLPHFRYEQIKNIVSSILTKYLPHDQIPVDVFALAKLLGIILVAYSTLTKYERRELQKICAFETKDGFCVCAKKDGKFVWYIYYDDSQLKERVRFTILHEIGHIVLGHREYSDLAEAEANFFAKYAIAPPSLVHLIKPNDYIDIMLKFDTSMECGWNCFSYYQKWKANFYAKGKKYEAYENDLFFHFGMAFAA